MTESVAFLLENFLPLTAMLVFMVLSAFFSSSEASLFYLSRRDRRSFATGNSAQRVVSQLLDDPERLLSAVLFCNLLVNVAYFSLASIVGLRLGGAAAGVFSFVSLLLIILFSEMLPKTLAVLQPRMMATLLGIPLAGAVRFVDPIMPALRWVNLLSRRLVWPGFEPETYLELQDLERAIDITSDPAHRDQERQVLQNVVSLSDVTVEELMSPRTHLVVYRPPVRLADLQGQLPPGGYLLITEPDNEEVASYVPLHQVSYLPNEHLEHFAEDVLYLPWCASASKALELMRERDRDVAAVVNEYGETVGVMTIDDVMYALFSEHLGRAERMFSLSAIIEVEPQVWHVSGMAGLRRLARFLKTEFPTSKNVTLAGALQEVLERFPQVGDEGVWGNFHYRIVQATDRRQILVELRPSTEKQEEPER